MMDASRESPACRENTDVPSPLSLTASLCMMMEILCLRDAPHALLEKNKETRQSLKDVCEIWAGVECKYAHSNRTL